MTTGSDPALPVEDPQNQPQDPQQQVPPADLDELELKEAKAAAQAEDAGDPPPQPDKPSDAPPSGQQPQDKPQGQPQPEVVMIPKPRLDEALQQARQAEQNAAYWRGIAEARAQQPAPQGQQPPPAPQQLTPEQRLADIHQRTDALAKKFDTGEITMEEFKREERKLQQEEREVHDASLLQRVQPVTTAAKQGSDELYLESLTAKLETDHPWVMVFDQVGTDSDWDYLKNRALDNLVQKGIDPRNGSLGRYELRREMAELADQLGPLLVGERAKAKGIALPNGQSQQQQQRPAADARMAKLKMQEGAPPNLAAITGSSEDPAMPTDARIETMTDEEIAALPAATRKKLLGITA